MNIKPIRNDDDLRAAFQRLELDPVNYQSPRVETETGSSLLVKACNQMPIYT